jgi:hypothetical protein
MCILFVLILLLDLLYILKYIYIYTLCKKRKKKKNQKKPRSFMPVAKPSHSNSHVMSLALLPHISLPCGPHPTSLLSQPFFSLTDSKPSPGFFLLPPSSLLRGPHSAFSPLSLPALQPQGHARPAPVPRPRQELTPRDQRQTRARSAPRPVACAQPPGSRRVQVPCDPRQEPTEARATASVSPCVMELECRPFSSFPLPDFSLVTSPLMAP